MKPFNLEAAKRGEPIVTRDGRPAHFIAHVPEAVISSRVVVLIGDFIYVRNVSGLEENGAKCSIDLFMAPTKRTVWVSLYRDGHSCHHETQGAADYNLRPGRIGDRAWPLEIEE